MVEVWNGAQPCRRRVLVLLMNDGSRVCKLSCSSSCSQQLKFPFTVRPQENQFPMKNFLFNPTVSLVEDVLPGGRSSNADVDIRLWRYLLKAGQSSTGSGRGCYIIMTVMEVIMMLMIMAMMIMMMIMKMSSWVSYLIHVDLPLLRLGWWPGLSLVI